MVQNTISRRNRDVAEYLAATSISDEAAPAEEAAATKSPQSAAELAQQLATHSSWADRYVPSTTTASETGMTPSTSSVADHSEAAQRSSEYETPDEAPPTYELATSSSADTPASSERGGPLPAFSQPRPHQLLPPFSQPRPHELMAPFGSSQSQTSQQPPFVPGKHYERHETSNSITGTFTLHDSLDLSTTSGSISIKLDVKPAPYPAVLKLKAKSGSIRVDDKQCDVAHARFSRGTQGCGRGRNECSGPGPLSFLFGWGKQRSSRIEQPPQPQSDDPRKQPGQGQPGAVQVAAGEEQSASQSDAASETSQEEVAIAPRVIHATIETASGSVNTHLIVTPGADTRISTTSGSINLRFISTGSGQRALSKVEAEDSRNLRDLKSFLSTTSGSGSQSVHVQSSVTDTSGGEIVSAMQADHHITGSGSMSLYYPRDWMGLVHASCGGSGSCNVRGNGLEYEQRGNREIWAWRGIDPSDGAKAIEVRCDGSGSVNFTC